jgi:hypothetical protein
MAMLRVDERFLDGLMDRARDLGASYADVRAESHVAMGASAENGTMKSLFRGAGTSLGIRALAGGTWGFASSDICSRKELRRRAKECLERAVSAARALSCFEPVVLAPVKPVRQKIPYSRKERASTKDILGSPSVLRNDEEAPGVVMLGPQPGRAGAFRLHGGISRECSMWTGGSTAPPPMSRAQLTSQSCWKIRAAGVREGA